MGHLERQNNQFYEFGPFRLAAAEHRLYRNGEVIMLPPKEFDLLLLLVQNPGTGHEPGEPDQSFVAEHSG